LVCEDIRNNCVYAFEGNADILWKKTAEYAKENNTPPLPCKKVTRGILAMRWLNGRSNRKYYYQSTEYRLKQNCGFRL
jgi:hypothetical protein